MDQFQNIEINSRRETMVALAESNRAKMPWRAATRPFILIVVDQGKRYVGRSPISRAANGPRGGGRFAAREIGEAGNGAHISKLGERQRSLCPLRGSSVSPATGGNERCASK